MGWSLGYDDKWKRDIGYGVPAYCDQPFCNNEINRGLSHVCGGEPYGGEHGCGLFFCAEHLYGYPQFCDRCAQPTWDERDDDWEPQPPYEPTADHVDWVKHKLFDESWEHWRQENPDEVAELIW